MPVIPKPLHCRATGAAPFVLDTTARVVAGDEHLRGPAELLADRLHAPVGATERPGDIRLRLGDPDTGATTGFARREAYRLSVTSDAVTIVGATAAGVFRGTQTLLQLLPGPIAATEITDHPRLAERGLMLDPARSFLTVADVERVIDGLVMVKANRLHLHLTDDQSWRLEIRSWPRLAEHSRAGAVAGCPSGVYSQADYAEIVRYAADRYITVVPEIDVPGHTTAAVSAYPRLGLGQRPVPLMTSDGVGTVSLDVGSDLTYTFLDDVVREVAELTPGPYLHLGGDEVTGLSDEQYTTFLHRARRIVTAYGKTMIAWTPAPRTGLDPSVVHHYWADRAGDMSPAWFAGDRPVILSPTLHAYLDYGFAPGESIGIKYTDRTCRAAYDWDPAAVRDETTGCDLTTGYGLTEAQTQGIEAAVWGETMRRGRPDVERAIWPRLAGLMEKAWSPPATFDDHARRLARFGTQLRAAGITFWPDPEIPWTGPAGRGI
ncbi:beta-N-acetylhexosaminidase [Actinoplanes sp. NPDC049265]|uniref:beta-N-acetylhexosaminidase n=1 Tax=Actinoplanes sp. NPDC049265 TaxID=3363902 RepID=UPI00371BD04D